MVSGGVNSMTTSSQHASSRLPDLFRVPRRILENQRGSISIITAVSLPVVLGFGGLAVDASIWLRAKNAVQAAADAAASSVAAAAVKASGGACTGRLSAEATGVA